MRGKFKAESREEPGGGWGVGGGGPGRAAGCRPGRGETSSRKPRWAAGQ